jgi:hypothetical protein
MDEKYHLSMKRIPYMCGPLLRIVNGGVLSVEFDNETAEYRFRLE